jgi:hypothetical protein
MMGTSRSFPLADPWSKDASEMRVCLESCASPLEPSRQVFRVRVRVLVPVKGTWRPQEADR